MRVKAKLGLIILAVALFLYLRPASQEIVYILGYIILAVVTMYVFGKKESDSE